MQEHLAALATHCFYAGELEAGRRACESLLSQPLDARLEHQIRANRTFYTQPLSELASVSFLKWDIPPAHEGWSLFNPTIILHGDRLLGIVRSSNYRIENGRYIIPDADGELIRTENILVELDDNLDVFRSQTITGPEYKKTGFAVDGLEDCRLRLTPSGVGVSATVRNVAPFDGRCRIATADLDIEKAEFSNLRVLSSLQLQEHEKNWMPAGTGWVYAANHNGHTVTVEPDQTCGSAFNLLQRQPAPAISRGFRGGGQVVPWCGGWLGIVHEVAHLPTGHRVYEHRFLTWDDSWRMVEISPAFSFLKTQAIEFAAGIAVKDGQVIVTFGAADAEAYVASIKEDDVARMLKQCQATDRRLRTG